ncbi:uncharacterized protein [Pseudorasbora parva]|uniref:uncharacterized protein n=1 Tax=Pseudorasbora parva TaxID=51549 RepID=UPI00351EAF1C
MLIFPHRRSSKCGSSGEQVNAAGWGTASQSAVYYDWYPQKALDLNPSTFTYIPAQTNPWWKLDLLKVYTVNRVVITNRQDCCSERLNWAEIRVGNVSPDVFSNPICAVISNISAGASYSYLCDRMEGRYVFVVIPGTSKILALAEVKVYVVYPGNLAAGGSVIQSSTYGSWIAGQAIDFNPGFIQPSLACSSTHTQTNPWWRLDLRNTYRVSRVIVTYRQDCCPEHINGAEIRIGNSLNNNGNNNPVCAVISSIPAGVPSTYTCNEMEGRYVNLIIPGYSRYLNLCEVEVYGKDNLAKGGNVTQSSTYGSWIAGQAIDSKPGFTQPQLACSSTTNQTDPWWRLDLRHIYRVSNVLVTNRNDCCPEHMNGAEIRIGNSLENNGNNNPVCAVISSIPAGVLSNYTCNDMEGRYVNLIIPGDSRILTLCEVEVYGEGPCLKQTFVKLKLKSSSSLSDAAARAQLLTQLESVLAGRGISGVKLRWSQLPKQEAMQKEAAPTRCGGRK